MRRSHRAFTLIELLVVIAIIAVLDRAAAAGRTSCPRGCPTRPVRQQSQAGRPGDAQLHRQHRNAVPAGPDASSGTYPAVLAASPALLGFMEQTTLFNSINFYLSSYDPSERHCAARCGQSFLCPSDAGWTGPPGLIVTGIGAGRDQLSGQRGTSVAMWYGAQRPDEHQNGIIARPMAFSTATSWSRSPTSPTARATRLPSASTSSAISATRSPPTAATHSSRAPPDHIGRRLAHCLGDRPSSNLPARQLQHRCPLDLRYHSTRATGTRARRTAGRVCSRPRGSRHRQQPALRRGKRLLGRRLRPVHQEHDQHRRLARTRHAERRRNHQRRQLLRTVLSEHPVRLSLPCSTDRSLPVFREHR